MLCTVYVYSVNIFGEISSVTCFVFFVVNLMDKRENCCDVAYMKVLDLLSHQVFNEEILIVKYYYCHGCFGTYKMWEFSCETALILLDLEGFSQHERCLFRQYDLAPAFYMFSY